MTNLSQIASWALRGGFAVLALAAAGPAAAQGLDFASGDEPVTIDANNGIEWQRDRSAYVARGNATATRGETSVRADELVAYYTPESDGSDIYRIDAVGGVVILGPQQRVLGDRAVYDVLNGIVVITGEDMSLTTPTEILTARDSMEYWANDQMAVARGDAVICTGSERLSAEVLTAYFRDDGAADGPSAEVASESDNAGSPLTPGAGTEGQKLDRVEAFGGVEILTTTDRAEADQGIYYARDEIAFLTDNVRISQGANQLMGTAAEYDLVTRIFKVDNARMYFVQQAEEQPEGQAPCQVPVFEMVQNQ